MWDERYGDKDDFQGSRSNDFLARAGLVKVRKLAAERGGGDPGGDCRVCAPVVPGKVDDKDPV